MKTQGKDWILLSKKNRFFATEARCLFIARVAKKKRSREVTYCHIPRVSELKGRRCREAAKEAQRFKGISPLSARGADFSEKILPIVVEEKEETTMTAPSVYTRRKPLSLAGARLPQTRNGLEKSGERAGDARTHRGQRERLQKEGEEEEREGKGGGFIPRAL